MNDFAQIRGECSSCPSGGLPVLTAPPFSVQLYQLFPLLPRYEGAQEDLGCIYSPGSLCCCLLHPSEGREGREGGRDGRSSSPEKQVSEVQEERIERSGDISAALCFSRLFHAVGLPHGP